jgi:hypothetical protein
MRRPACLAMDADGFTSAIAIRPATARAVIVFSNSTESTDDIAFHGVVPEYPFSNYTRAVREIADFSRGEVDLYDPRRQLSTRTWHTYGSPFEVRIRVIVDSPSTHHLAFGIAVKPDGLKRNARATTSAAGFIKSIVPSRLTVSGNSVSTKNEACPRPLIVNVDECIALPV